MTSEPRSAKETIEAIIADGKLTRAELKRLDGALLADGQVSDEERQLLADLLDRIARGELQLTD